MFRPVSERLRGLEICVADARLPLVCEATRVRNRFSLWKNNSPKRREKFDSGPANALAWMHHPVGPLRRAVFAAAFLRLGAVVLLVLAQ